jgi:hypothetical protein
MQLPLPRPLRHLVRLVPLAPLPALLAALLLLAGPAAPPPAAAADSPLAARRPGEEVIVADCLGVAVLGFTDRNGPLDPADWVTLKVSNHCKEPARHLLVDLLLLDAFGQAYGARLWLLEGGEVLMPGHSKTDRYAVPDTGDHMPQRWAVRVQAVDLPSLHRAPASPGPARRARRSAQSPAAR